MAASEQATDATLVHRARDGDQDALGVLLNRYADQVRARVRHQLSPALQRKASIADVVQEAHLVAAQRLHEFEDCGAGSFGNWLAKIAENRARKVVDRYAGTAKRQLAREISRGARPDTCQFPAQGPSPSQLAMAGELREAATRALRRLPDDDREVLRLVQDEDRSFAEVAKLMDRSPDAVRMLYGRALDRFARILDVERGGGR